MLIKIKSIKILVMSNKINTDNYKGVRDFYPEDQAIQNYIFKIWKETMESFGYEQYDASILESSDLYKAKSSQEIVNEQTYSFSDRGDRDVTLRPEMTPTIARMIAKKRGSLTFPLRWFSIPNLFRYERPQKGRLREHWQLNADLFGVDDIQTDVEMIEIAYTILKNFGLRDDQFEIRINNRKLINKTFKELGLNMIESNELSRLLDKKDKIKDFDKKVEELLGRKINLDIKPDESIIAIKEKLALRGITNVVFVPELTRGFDYYTGIIFEIFDKNPENNRSLFGGGRYDDLLNIFNAERIPAVGFGMGDVMLRETLATYSLLPKNISKTNLLLCPLNDAFFDIAADWAGHLRDGGLNVSVDYSGKKLDKQIRNADKNNIPFIACIGENEVKKEKLSVKELRTGKQKLLSLKKIPGFVKKVLNK